MMTPDGQQELFIVDLRNSRAHQLITRPAPTDLMNPEALHEREPVVRREISTSASGRIANYSRSSDRKISLLPPASPHATAGNDVGALL